MKVFLTGGTGFIGQALTQALLARGWQVVALVRKPTSAAARALAKKGAKCVTGDVTERESMREGMAGADIVVHSAAWYELGVTRSAQPLMHAINVTGTDNVLSLAREVGVSRALYVSSTAFYGDTGGETRDETYQRQKPYFSYYEQTKAEAHGVAQHYQQTGLPLMIVCPAHVLGPNDHSNFGYFLRMYLNWLMAPCAFSPKMKLSPAHVVDISEGIALAAEKGRPGETYILAGDSTSLREIFNLWKTFPGGFKIGLYIPRWLAWLMFAPLEPLQRLLNLPTFLSRETVVASSICYNFSSLKAQRELGWSYRPEKEMWQDIIREEMSMLARRQKRDVLSRLKPMETND
jgi:dihydroflavonol-4-reductase